MTTERFRFEIKIDSADDAFQDGNAVSEIRRILVGVADRLELEVSGSLADANGNRVGSWSLVAVED